MALEYSGPVLVGGTEEGNNTVANSTNGLATGAEVLQNAGQGPPVGQVSQAPWTAVNQESKITGSLGVSLGLEMEILHPVCSSLQSP